MEIGEQEKEEGEIGHLYSGRLPQGEMYLFYYAERMDKRQGDTVEAGPFRDIGLVKRNVPTLGNGLEIRESTIRNAGLGLFTTRYYHKEEIITYYDGFLLTWKEFFQRLKEDKRYYDYATPLFRGQWMIVGNMNERGEWIQDPRVEMQGRGLGAFMNDGKPNVLLKELDTARNDDLFFRYKDGDPDHRIIVARATRRIEPGEELFISYGSVGRVKHGIIVEKKKVVSSSESSSVDDSGDLSQELGDEDTYSEEEDEV
jgi:hypothetical protein